MRVALADNRRCFIMLFSTDVVRYELSGPEGIEQAIRFLSQRFRGGTDIASCFRAIIERMQGRNGLMPMRWSFRILSPSACRMTW